MWCFHNSSTTRVHVRRRKRLDHTSEHNEKLEKFDYLVVPLYIQHRKFGWGLRQHDSAGFPANPSTIIRLLRIIPAKSHGSLTCQIRTAELNGVRPPRYDALSYTWGPTTRNEIKKGMNGKENHVIICNKKQLLVTENLFNCLAQLAENGYYNQDIWIDAICMNQGDRAEVCQQVSVMADIYRSAERVIIWLGASDEFTQPAFQLMDRLRRLSKEELATIEPQVFDKKSNDALLRSANSPGHWKALALLFGRTWFTRTWVVQELVLARDTIMLCGSYTFNWEAIVSVSHFMATRTSSNMFKTPLFQDLADSSLSYKNPAKLAAVKRSTEKETSDLLLHSLIRCRTYDASKDHDKIFSLLGLANPHTCEYPDYMYPNYEKSVAKLYTDVARYIIETSEDLHILAHAEGDQFRDTTGLPTWAPDWSVKKDLGLRITGYARYNAARDLPCFKEIRDDDTLVVRGFELDTITRIGETKAEVNSSKVCADWLDLLGELEREHPDRDYRDAFWRTLLIDTDPSSTVPITRPWQDSFDVWMKLCAHEPSEEEKRRAVDFETSFTHSLHLRLFRTARGHLGCGTLSCKSGDSVWIVPGSRVPLILRPALKADRPTYQLVGGTYLHGFMQGEALLGGREIGEVSLI
ncbi:HET-domain-containing protein [Hypoxylon sp. NC1633]|nr:HET-domain-containing protein [Hypoxylon sp. NC1633]